MEEDLGREIRRAVDTGTVVLGLRESEKLVLLGNAKGLVASKNAPKSVREKLKYLAGLSEIPFREFRGTSQDLGAVCGKPYSVSALVVQNEGDSSVLSLLKKEKKAAPKKK